MIEAIYTRRSIRHFIQKPIPEDVLEEILTAGTWAPSEKNQQPWHFIVVRGKARREMVRCLKDGIARNRGEGAVFSGYDRFIGSAVYTARILEQAAAVVFAVNPFGLDPTEDHSPAERMKEWSDIESISAAVQNMALAATDAGVGSLWTCNIFFAQEELKAWLACTGEPVCALALGYTDKEVRPLPRKPLAEVVEYRDGEPAAE